jgi:hypothetical protein
MSRRTDHSAFDRRSLLGGALIGGVGAALGAQAVSATPSGPRAAIVPPPIWATEPLNLRMLLTPARVYDSRSGQLPDGTDPVTGATDTRLLVNQTRRIDVSFILGVEENFSGVPADSEAVLLNVTAVNCVGNTGYLKLWADGGTEPSTSSLNWDHQAATIANSVTTRHGNGYINVRCGGPAGGSVNFIIDVLGYYESTVLL